MKQLRKILPWTLDNGQCDTYYALKARDDLLKNECGRQEEYNGNYTDTPM